jgi:hypothetical protein
VAVAVALRTRWSGAYAARFLFEDEVEDACRSTAFLLGQALLLAVDSQMRWESASRASPFALAFAATPRRTKPARLGWVVRFHRLLDGQVPWPTTSVTDYSKPLLTLTTESLRFGS